MAPVTNASSETGMFQRAVDLSERSSDFTLSPHNDDAGRRVLVTIEWSFPLRDEPQSAGLPEYPSPIRDADDELLVHLWLTRPVRTPKHHPAEGKLLPRQPARFESVPSSDEVFGEHRGAASNGRPYRDSDRFGLYYGNDSDTPLNNPASSMPTASGVASSFKNFCGGTIG